MAYDVPSREKVKKAGKVLINVDATANEFEQAMAVIAQLSDQYLSSHAKR